MNTILFQVPHSAMDEERLHALACLGSSPQTRINAMEKLPPKKESIRIFDAIFALDPNDNVRLFAKQLLEQHSPA